MLNCKNTASSGHPIYAYEPPAPQIGNHRNIFVLFEQEAQGRSNIEHPGPRWNTPTIVVLRFGDFFAQVKPGNIGDFNSRPREGWDLRGFMRTNRAALKPISVNFFYLDSSRSDQGLLSLDNKGSEA